MHLMFLKVKAPPKYFKDIFLKITFFIIYNINQEEMNNFSLEIFREQKSHTLISKI